LKDNPQINDQEMKNKKRPGTRERQRYSVRGHSRVDGNFNLDIGRCDFKMVIG
jgi:hypothetical protein